MQFLAPLQAYSLSLLIPVIPANFQLYQLLGDLLMFADFPQSPVDLPWKSIDFAVLQMCEELIAELFAALLLFSRVNVSAREGLI
jgi:hypothetical protein